jgi:branched-chain amino acid transport system substrate-binding protein
MHQRSVQLGATVAAIGLVLTACGQKPGVHQETAFGGIPGGFTTTIDGEIVDPATGETITPGPGGIPLPTGGSSSSGGDPNNPTDPGAPVSGDRTGITDTTITIGVHAPTTGAAPIESVVFEKGGDVYWRWLESKGQDVLGRQVKVVFRNDEYRPTTAVAVCSQMAENDKAFLLIGGAGTDQINACASYADQKGIPYLSPGVQEAGLGSRSNYFAVSMTYRAQMQPLVQLLKRMNAKSSLDKYGSVNGGDGKIKIAHVRPNTPNFDDADAALSDAVKAAGWEYKTYSVVKEGNSSEAQTVAAQLQQQGFDVVVPITAPLFTSQLVIQADKNGYKPQWSGVAITNNVNAMIDTACKGNNPGMNGAVFFSPWPGLLELTDPGKPLDKDFVEAAKKFAPSVLNRKNGDLLYALWGIMRTIHQMFEKAGPNVTRESFIQVNRSFSYKSGLFPTLNYGGQAFGAKDVNVLLGRCSQGGNTSEGGPVENGPQWITHPDYRGLRSSF